MIYSKNIYSYNAMKFNSYSVMLTMYFLITLHNIHVRQFIVQGTDLLRLTVMCAKYKNYKSEHFFTTFDIYRLKNVSD